MKFETYLIVRLEGSLGKWVVLCQAFSIDKNDKVLLIENQYIIKSTEPGHSQPPHTVSADKLELL